MSTKTLVETAVRLRAVLLVLLGLLILLAIALGFFGTQYLHDEALKVQTVVYDATNGDQKLLRTQQLASQLAANQDAVARAEKIVGDSKSYAYQNVIIRDLQAMAAKANVSITNFDFDANTTTNTSTAKPTVQPSTGGGLRSTFVNVTVKSPVNYRNFLNFLHYIEQNLTKMQISRVGLSSVTGDEDQNSVTSETLTIEVYIR